MPEKNIEYVADPTISKHSNGWGILTEVKKLSPEYMDLYERTRLVKFEQVDLLRASQIVR